MKTKCPWVVVEQGSLGAKCNRCGAVERPPALPISIRDFAKWTNQVLARHAHCDPLPEGGKT